MISVPFCLGYQEVLGFVFYSVITFFWSYFLNWSNTLYSSFSFQYSVLGYLAILSCSSHLCISNALWKKERLKECYFPQTLCYFARVFWVNDDLTQGLSKEVLWETPPNKEKQKKKFFEQKRLENIYYILELPLEYAQRILRRVVSKNSWCNKNKCIWAHSPFYVIQKNTLSTATDSK